MQGGLRAEDISIGAEEAEVEDHGSELKKVSSGIGDLPGSLFLGL